MTGFGMMTVGAVLAHKMGFEQIWSEAVAAGYDAVDQLNVRPMVVSSGSQQWYVADGVCGFAWVKVPGNTAFGKWGKAKGLFSKAYPKGLMYWVGEFNQSMQKKEAFADAVAAKLREHGIEAYSDSRMD
jgi:hypothetical protein